MAIFIYMPDIEGDAKEKFIGAPPGSDYWYIRAESIQFSFQCNRQDDSSGEGTEAGAQAQRSGERPNQTPLSSAPHRRPVTPATQGGNYAASVDELIITKKMDFASSWLADRAVNFEPPSQGAAPGPKVVPNGAIIYVTTSQRELLLKITIPTCIVTNYDVTINSGADNFDSGETVKLKFDKIEWRYHETNSKGSLAYTSDFKWPKAG